LDDLRFQLIHVYRLSPNNINIENLTEDELDKLAQRHGFIIPPDVRLKQLIRNPFYLNQYLTYYSEDSQKVKYSDFKSNLWNIKIKNSSYTKDNLHIERENCFLSLAKDRSESGNFYSKAERCNSRILSLLQNDEIIEYSSTNSGYFITHDIYEEWALELLIKKAYQNNADATLFLHEIGTSLSIRRAFRLWITDKIFNQSNEVEQLIEEVIHSNNIRASWKDEIFISILLSDLSITFFSEIKEILFKDDFRLLRRVIFLLRIACKEVNEPLMKQLKGSEEISPEYIFTKPKGDGWKAIIDLVFDEINSFRIEDASFLIPLLKEWNAEFKFGSITKNSTKIALKIYEDIISENDTYSYSDISKELVKSVIQGAKEVTHELKEIFENVVTNNWSEHDSPYYKLCKYVLTKTLENIPVIAALPNEVMKIADLFWFNSATKDDMFDCDGMDMEQYYSLNENDFDYDPSSALQTPIYWLLLFSPKETFDFIISFINKSVESFSKSKYGETVELIDIHIDNDTIQKQFVSDALWSMYRGTGSLSTPNVLQCIHMALEKYLLEQAKVDESNNLSGWLKYLVRNSKSASITSVVASVVKAYPDKYFEIAEILFKTIDLFFYDMMLLNSEHHADSLYKIGYGFNQQHKMHEDERMKTLEDSHRNTCLEHTALKYQLFRSENISVEEVEKKQKTIWAIIDNYYQTELSKNEKLLFVRIDSRKMKPKIEQKGDKILIDCNPEIDPELKKYSEEGQAEFSGFMKYSALGVWSRNKFKQRQDIAQYTQYENNPKRVIKEIKELLSPETSKPTHFDFATPAFAGYVLLKEYSKDLSKGELELCRDIIIDFASNPLKEGYGYQTFDGVEVAINAIPLLYDLFPDNILDYNTLLLFILFDEYQLGEYKRVCDYSIESIINSLWKKSSEDALKIIYAYLYFKPLLNNFIKALKPDNPTPYRLRKPQALIIKEFLEEYERQLEKFFQIDYENFSVDSIDFTNYEFIELEITLQLIPNDTKNDILTNFVLGILPILSEKVLRHDNESRLFRFRMRFFRKICPFILMRDSQNIKLFTTSFVNNLTPSEEVKYLLEEFIRTEHRLERYKQFWLVWEEFYNSIVNISKGGGGYYEQDVIYSYLLALPSWTKEAKEWHSLKVKDKKFYKKIVSDIGDNVYVLDSIAQILNQIGSNFLNEGIVWISDMLDNNRNLWWDKLGVNTIYYLELLIRRYLFINRTKVRREKNLKKRVLIILNFLIEKSSVNAYLLREEIL
jgi:hypothetical protein